MWHCHDELTDERIIKLDLHTRKEAKHYIGKTFISKLASSFLRRITQKVIKWIHIFLLIAACVIGR
jgi:hypothetical protein